MRSMDAFGGAAAMLLWALMGIHALALFHGTASAPGFVQSLARCTDGGVDFAMGCESIQL